MYVRSHASYAPGEQRRRGYQWEAAGVDIGRHRFGAVRKGDDQGGVKGVLQPSVEDQVRGDGSGGEGRGEGEGSCAQGR